MKVSEIYEKFNIPQNLRTHMLRAAAISKIIFDNWTGGKVDRSATTMACAMHDIAKPVSFDLSIQAEYGTSEEEIVNLGKLQNLIKSKYGTDEHKAAAEMCRDIGVNSKSVEIIKNLEWPFLPRLFKENNIEALVAIYSDMRIGPNGILSLSARVDNLQKRRFTGHDFEGYQRNGKVLQQRIQESVKIDLNKMTDDNLNSRFDEILNTEI